MIITQGEKRIKHKIIWFLSEIKDFVERRLYIFEYYTKENKKKYITVLCEKNRYSQKEYQQKAMGADALNVIERESSRKIYTSDDVLKSKKGRPYGWTYPLNIPVFKKGKAIKSKMLRCDDYGNKELIDIVPIFTYNLKDL